MRRGKKSTKRQLYDRKNPSKPKSLGLFDHIKQITQIQNPEYFQNLSEEDKKSFNHFLILKAISMNPSRLEDVALIYRYFDIIPSPQLYRLLISINPPDNRFYRWVKSKKKNAYSKELLELMMRKFECSPKEAREYVDMLSVTKGGKDEMHGICRGFGLTEKEIGKVMVADENE